MKRVIGIGNALTDMLVNLESDSVLGRFKLAKGSMSLVDTKLQTEISKSVAGLPYSLSLGGSAGNTIRAMAKLGCQVGFIGKVGQDTTGDFFVQALENLGVEPVIFRGSKRSGKCVSLISPDGERTMVTYLGAALELTAAEIDPAIFDGYDCLYIEGYIVQDHDLIRKAARTAKECGLKVAIDLASFNIVAENLEFLRNLVRDYVDIVFANEDEAKTFACEAEPLNALEQVLVVPRAAFEEAGYFQGHREGGDHYLNAFMKPGVASFMDREAAENDPSHKQIIAYAIFCHQGRILHYTRGGSGGEARLHDKGSIGIGGHINPVDRQSGHDDVSTYLAGVEREIREELVIDGNCTQRVLGVINDDTNDVGAVHLGIVHLFELDTDRVRANEAALANLRFVSPEELSGEMFEKLETWSQLALELFKNRGA